MRKLAFFAILAIGTAAPGSASAVELRSLDGSGNSLNHRDWGQVGTQTPAQVIARNTDSTTRPFSFSVDGLG
jgi:hypothetical protein